MLAGLGSATRDLRAQGSAKAAPPAQRQLPGLQTTEAPWPRELAYLSERLKAIGLPAMPNESFVVHIHQVLKIAVRGKNVPVPAGIGIHELAGFISPIHTHDGNGQIHIEAPSPRPFTLGQFFDVWGVRFTANCIGGYCTSGRDSLKVLSNGAPVKGNPRSLVLADNQQIEIRFGNAPKGPVRVQEPT